MEYCDVCSNPITLRYIDDGVVAVDDGGKKCDPCTSHLCGRCANRHESMGCAAFWDAEIARAS